MNFAVSHELAIDVQRFGETREPILQIDDFAKAPDDLVTAASQAEWEELPAGGYPGQRAPLPSAYARALLKRLDAPIRARLLPEGARLKRFECSFSMVTRAPDALTSLQRIPHIDVANPHRVAILHYLCAPAHGGTAFFRQLSTGYEQVTPETRRAYLEARKQDIGLLEPEHRFPDDSTPGYAQTHRVDAAYNRVVAYRSCSLHSGVIAAPEGLTPDPRSGRLTANFFVDYEVA